MLRPNFRSFFPNFSSEFQAINLLIICELDVQQGRKMKENETEKNKSDIVLSLAFQAHSCVTLGYSSIEVKLCIIG